MRPHEPRDRSGSSRDARHARGDHATGGSCLRDRDIVERYLRGESQADIARAVGVSRERVRQRLSRNGLQGRSHGWVPDAVRLAGALATSRSLADAAQRLGLAETRLRAAVARHGMTEALCEAQRRWRRERVEDRRRWRRQQLLEALRDLACRVGHTPTQREMRRAVLCHTALPRVFGSASIAMRAAGLTPNRKGCREPADGLTRAAGGAAPPRPRSRG